MYISDALLRIAAVFSIRFSVVSVENYRYCCRPRNDFVPIDAPHGCLLPQSLRNIAESTTAYGVAPSEISESCCYHRRFYYDYCCILAALLLFLVSLSCCGRNIHEEEVFTGTEGSSSMPPCESGMSELFYERFLARVEKRRSNGLPQKLSSVGNFLFIGKKPIGERAKCLRWNI